MRKSSRRSAAAITGLGLIALSAALALRVEGQIPPVAYVDPALHRSGFVRAGGLRLHYLDFGGSGEPLLLLAGAGHTAHVWDEFAPRLTGRFRVLALTRRGFGESEQPHSGYERAMLAEDIRTLLDSLGIRHIHLVGHSIAGEEMTRFAATYPGRVRKLVYIDAAYDRVAARQIGSSGVAADTIPRPTQQDRASPEAWRNYFERANNFRLPESELRAMFEFGPDGRLVRQRAWQGQVPTQTLFGATEAPEYEQVRAPALAIYQKRQPPSETRPWLAHDTAAMAVLERWYRERVLPNYRDKQIGAFRARVRRGRAIELRGTHYLFQSNADEVAGLVKSFLLDGEARIPRP